MRKKPFFEAAIFLFNLLQQSVDDMVPKCCNVTCMDAMKPQSFDDS